MGGPRQGKSRLGGALAGAVGDDHPTTVPATVEYGGLVLVDTPPIGDTGYPVRPLDQIADADPGVARVLERVRARIRK